MNSDFQEIAWLKSNWEKLTDTERVMVSQMPIFDNSRMGDLTAQQLISSLTTIQLLYERYKGEDEEFSDLVTYYVVNKDLNMSPGKVIPQVAHVATNIAVDIFTKPNHPALPNYLSWYNDGKTQTKIILQGKEKDLLRLIGEGWYSVRDNGLTELSPGSLTVVGCLPVSKASVSNFVRRLRLYSSEN